MRVIILNWFNKDFKLKSSAVNNKEVRQRNRYFIFKTI